MTDCPVVFCLNDIYTIPTFTSAYSLVKHYTGKEVSLIFIYNDLSESNKRILEKLGNLSEFNVKVDTTFIDIKTYDNLPVELIDNLCKEAKNRLKNMSEEVYYRFFMIDLVNTPRALNLDSDTIVLQDIRKLLETPMTDDEYLSATKHFSYISPSYRDAIRGTPNTYVNVGISLWNLDSMRKNNVLSMFLDDMMSRYHTIADQDTINIICHGHIKDMPVIYNAGTKLRAITDPQDVYTQEDIDSLATNMHIVHFSGTDKPWYREEEDNYFFPIFNEVIEKGFISKDMADDWIMAINRKRQES